MINVAVSSLVFGDGNPGEPLPTVNLRLVSQRLTVKEIIANVVQEPYAEIGFPEARYYLASEATLTIDEIWFQGGEEVIPLAEVEPILFSEVMRDVDLIASVAQVDEDDLRWCYRARLWRQRPDHN